MSIQANQKELQRQIELLTPITKGRSHLPILSNMAISFAEDTSEMFASNLEIYIKTKVSLEQMISPLKTTVNSEKVSEILKNLRSDIPVQIEAKENQRIVISQGTSRFEISTLPYDDFPVFPAATEKAILVNVKTLDLIRGLESVTFAASDSDSRFNLNAVCVFPEENNIKLVTTDGHRLALYNVGCGLHLDDPVKLSMLPKSSAIHLLKWASRIKDEQIELQIHPKAFTLETPEFYVSMRLLDGDYPDYTKVIPPTDACFSVDKTEITNAVKRVGLITSDRNRGIQFNYDGEGVVNILCRNPELGEAADQIVVDHGDIAPFEIILNRDYVLDSLQALNTQTVFVFVDSNPGKPVVFKAARDDENFNIIMPMRK